MSAWENHRLEWSAYPLSGLATLNANPYFEAGAASPWSGENGATVAASTAQAHQGSTSMLITPDGVTSTPQAQSEAVQAIAGVSYTLSGWMWAGLNVTRVLGLFWYDSGGNLLSSNTISHAIVAGTWTQYGPTAFTAPDQAVAVRIKTNGSGVASTPWAVDEAVLAADVASVPVAWQDITSYARAPGGGPPITISLGSPDTGSAAGTARPATMTVSLENIDHRFLFGSPAALVNWKPGRRIRCYEVIGCRRFDLFSGYMQAPETDDHAEAGIDQFVTVTAVDRLGRLGTDDAFASTLTEYIQFNGLPTSGYWTLLDPPASTLLRPIGSQQPLSTSFRSVAGGATTAATATPQGGTPVPGDDVGTLRLAPALVGTAVAIEADLSGVINTVTLLSGSTLTLAFWLYFEDVHTSDLVFSLASDAIIPPYLRLVRTSGAWAYEARAPGASVSTPTYGPQPGRWNLVALRLGPSTVDYWLNGVSTSAAIGGWADTSFNAVSFRGLQGNLAHLQIDVNSYSQAKHLAQYAEGLSGLAWQSTGQRIRTLARYAGIPATELGLIDVGTSYMQKASLAGQTPLAAMAVAETTEQGRLRANGQGLLVFDPRTRRYNA